MSGDGTNNFADFDTDDDLNWGDFGNDDSDNEDSLGSDNFMDTEPDEELPDNNEDTVDNSFDRSAKSYKFGYKAVGVILLIAMIILAGIFMFLDKISIQKKDPVPQQPVQQSSGENNGDAIGTNASSENVRGTETPVQEPEQTTQTSSGGMTALPPDVAIDYTGEILTTTGQVHNKLKYLENSQVIYCVQINALIGDSNKMVNYFCGYNVFDSVTEGDNVTLSYQAVSKDCYSVNTITK